MAKVRSEHKRNRLVLTIKAFVRRENGLTSPSLQAISLSKCTVSSKSIITEPNTELTIASRLCKESDYFKAVCNGGFAVCYLSL